MKNRNIYLFFTSIIFLPISISIFESFLKSDNFYIQIDNPIDLNDLKSSAEWTRGPFIIDGLGGGDYTWAQAVLEQWCSGSGNWTDPYIIQNVTITITTGNHGIFIRHSDVYFIVKNCKLSYTGSPSTSVYGLRLENVSNGVLTENTCWDNSGGGIRLDNSHNNTIKHNEVYNNKGYQIRLGNSENNTVYDNIMYLYNSLFSGDGIAMYYSHHNNISENSISGCDDHGIQIVGCNYNKVLKNTIKNNRFGFDLGSSSYNNFTDNVLTDNTNGFFLRIGSNYNRIIGNKIYGTFDCIIVDTTCFGNIIENNYCELSGGISPFLIITIVLLILIPIIGCVSIVSLVVLRKKKAKKIIPPIPDGPGIKCVKCGIKNATEEYIFKKVTESGGIVTHSYTIRTQSIPVPTCTNCIKILDRFKWHHSYSPITASFTIICGGFITVFCLGMAFSPYAGWMGGLLLLIPLCYIASLYYTIRGTIARKSKKSPHKYIKIKRNNTFIKPEGIEKWIPLKNWIMKGIQEVQQIEGEIIVEFQDTLEQAGISFAELTQNIDIPEVDNISCPKCGETSLKGTSFCANCGKDLRMYE